MMPTAGAAEGASARAWRSYRAELVRFVAARVRDASLADDIVHDVLVKALSGLRALDDPAKLRPWLYRITRNAIVDHHRSRRPSEPLPEELAGAEPESEQRAERELARCLTPLLETLPPPYRAALVASEVEGLPQRELARREGLSLSGAKSRVQRARRRLRDAVLACCRVELDQRGGVVDFERRGDCKTCDDGGGS
jgi:RNA polymerase sigma-70 factor (ECF subfamily)